MCDTLKPARSICTSLLLSVHCAGYAWLQESQIKRIFGTMINQKLQDFEEDVKALGDLMTQVTWNTVASSSPLINSLCTDSSLRAYAYLIVVLLQATIDIYNAIIAKMLPTPTKIHYLFNLRDISRVG